MTSLNTVPISDAGFQILKELSAQTGQAHEVVLEQALDAWRRKIFLERVNASYAALRADPAAWADLEVERASMAGSLLDGLDPQENWGEDGNLLSSPESGGHG